APADPLVARTKVSRDVVRQDLEVLRLDARPGQHGLPRLRVQGVVAGGTIRAGGGWHTRGVFAVDPVRAHAWPPAGGMGAACPSWAAERLSLAGVAASTWRARSTSSGVQT